MSTSKGDGIVDRILDCFPSRYTIEVHVADGSGDSFEVYIGPVLGLTSRHFDNIFREAGCFYSFTVIGILQELTNAVDVHHSNIKRSEFFWLTPPTPPYIISEESTSVLLSWDATKFCGCEVQIPEGCLEYVLELAEGCEWKDGKVARFVTDLTVDSYRQSTRSLEPREVLVQDLQPGVRYYARLAVEYLGCRVVSEAFCFHTPVCPPAAPLAPRIYVAPVVSQIDPSSEPAPNLVLHWSSARANGADVTKYQVQMQEVILREHYRPDDTYTPLFAKLQLKQVKVDRKILRGGRWVGATSKVVDKKSPGKSLEMQQPNTSSGSSPPTTAQPFQLADDTIVITRWANIYSNLDRKVKLVAPRPGALEWKFRVRAKNSHGWSPFSPLLCIHNRSHPALFPSEYPADYTGVTSYSPSSPVPLRPLTFTSTSAYSEESSPYAGSASGSAYSSAALQPPQPLSYHHHPQQQHAYSQQQHAYSQQQQQQPQQQQYYQQQQYMMQQQQLYQNQHHQQYGSSTEDYYDQMDEILDGQELAQGSGVLRKRAISASPSTSHDRRESFSSEKGGLGPGGVSAQSSRDNVNITEEHSHGLDGGSGFLDGRGSRGRSAPQNRRGK